MAKCIGLLKEFDRDKSHKIKVVLDTCIFIHYYDEIGEDADADIQTIFYLIDEEAIDGIISVVTISEIIKHLRDLEESGATSKSSIIEILESIEDNFYVVPLEYDIARDAGELKHRYSSKKRPLSYNDAFIASTAKFLNALLITCDGEFYKDSVVMHDSWR